MALKARLLATSASPIRMLARGRLRRAAFVLAGAVLLAFAAADTLQLVRALRYNAALDAVPVAAAASASATDTATNTATDTAADISAAAATAAAAAAGTDDAPAWALFVRAHAAARAQRTADAMALYQAAARDPAYAVAAHYNLANLHLREALSLAERDALAANPQPAELAKRHYRAALRREPGHWASKYNLERALRLAPESGDDGGAASGHAGDRAITSLRGFTLGLP